MKEAEMLSYKDVPKAVDMIPYADFYRKHVNRAIRENPNPEEVFRVVELGTRFGCSARILLDTMRDYSGKWELILVDIEKKGTIDELLTVPEVSFRREDAEAIAHSFDTRSINVLHVDLDPHTEEQTDYIVKLYRGKIAAEGVILFHDASDSFGVKASVGKLGSMKGWTLEFCKPDSSSPISVPAAAMKEVTSPFGRKS
jgi:hypothetical protein